MAVGEIGFDLYWDKTTLVIQNEAFERQVVRAKELALPIVIHVREAFEALFKAMDRLNDDRLCGVVHCFTGNLEQAERVLAYGTYLGIGGVATYKNGGLDAVLPHVDRDRVILKPTAPTCSCAYRGKRNESAYTAVVAQRVADLWNAPSRMWRTLPRQTPSGCLRCNFRTWTGPSSSSTRAAPSAACKRRPADWHR